MLDYFEKSVFDDLYNSLSEPPKRPLNPITTRKTKEEKFESLILTDEQKTLYREFKAKKLPEFYQSIKNYNSHVELLVGITIAKTLKAIDKPFYFKHHFDFRGRVYKSGSFSYDGGDFYRSLLEFSDGCVVNSQNVRWLYLHMASLLELPKGFTHEDRIQYVLNQSHTIKSWSRNPILNNQ